VGTPIEDIKKAYILKVHQISGAYQLGDEQAAEYLSVITRGYEWLSNPERKRVYDLMLLNYYLKQKKSDLNRAFYRKYGNSERNPIRDEGVDEEEEVRKPTPFVTEKMLAIARQGVRIERVQLVIACLLIIGLFVVYDFIYWKPYTDFKMVSYVFLTVSYVMLMVWTLQKIARFFEVRSILLRKKPNMERPILVAFLVMFFALPALASRGEILRRDYHMKFYAKTVNADNFMLEDHWLTVDYYVKGRPYKQSVSLGENAEHFRQYNFDTRKFLVKYSTENPRIIDVVLLH
jgi:hypothetical protein